MKIEEYLNQYYTLTYSNVGTSMLPLLRQGRDLLIIQKKTEPRCHVGDVVLYKRPPNRYILHRVVAVRENDYVIRGDNCVKKEYGITDADILGVMTGFVRDGKEYGVDGKFYRLYSSVIPYFAGIQARTRGVLRRLKRKLSPQRRSS